MAKLGDLRVKCARARALVEKLEAITAERKALYAEYDELAVALHKEESPLYGIAIEDRFAKGNTIFGHGPVRRFEIVVLEEKKLAKKAAAK